MYFYKVKQKQIEIMEVTIKLKRIELNGKVSLWDEKDAGFKKYAGSVYFHNNNYTGFLRHDGTVELKRNFKRIGFFKPENFIYV